MNREGLGRIGVVCRRGGRIGGVESRWFRLIWSLVRFLLAWSAPSGSL